MRMRKERRGKQVLALLVVPFNREQLPTLIGKNISAYKHSAVGVHSLNSVAVRSDETLCFIHSQHNRKDVNAVLEFVLDHQHSQNIASW